MKAMPRRTNGDELEALLRGLPPETRRLVRSLRQLVHRTVPRAEESLLWGALSYHRLEMGGRIKGAVCLIEFKAGVVRLGFVHGARLADPTHRLEGDGVSKRFVRITSAADVEQPQLAALIREAAAVEWG
jgi:hypothetical protein